MEQTVNTFNDGMITDLNPLSTPNNVLTSCLNGTFITYDGNEFVLQNDMGNGRVETAYLPSGFVPIGIKEYGGIIYVVSYNPLTNRSQIGSFPSPERNISSEELNTLDRGISDTDFFNKQLISTYQKIELFKNTDIKLRPGDQFAVIISHDSSTNIDELLSYLGDGKTRRVLRLNLGVLDDNNNFTLIDSELKKVDGYWAIIQNGKPSLDDYRSYEEHFNVFDNKTSGTLVVVAQLESIDSFEVSTVPDTEDNDNEIYKVGFESTFEDHEAIGLDSLSVKLEFNDSDPFREDRWEEQVNTYIHKSGLIHDPKIKFVANEIPKGLLRYTITPNMTFGPLSAFTRTGVIDTSMIHAGIANLVSWKYYNDYVSDTITIFWQLNFYPKVSETVEGVTFLFYDFKKGLQDPWTYNCKRRSSYNGSFSEAIPYSQDTLQRGSVYLVKISIWGTSTEDEVTSDTKELYYYYKFLYTTTIFNEEYYTESDFTELVPKVGINYNLSATQGTPNKKPTALDSDVLSFTQISKLYGNIYEDNSIPINTNYNTTIDGDRYPFNFNKENLKVDIQIQVPNKGTISNLSNKELGMGTSTDEITVKAEGEIDLHTYSESEVMQLKVELQNNILKVRTIGQLVAETRDSNLSGIRVKKFSPYINNTNESIQYSEGTFGYRPFNGSDAWPSFNFVAGSYDGGAFHYLAPMPEVGSDINVPESSRISYLRKVKWFTWTSYSKKGTKTGKDNTFDACSEAWSRRPTIITWTSEHDKRDRTVIWNTGNPEDTGWAGAIRRNDPYTLAMWLDVNGTNYYMVNLWSGKTATNNAIVDLKNVFKQVYIGRTGPVDQTVYVANNGIYNSSYNLNLNLSVNGNASWVSESAPKITLPINGTDTDFTEANIKSLLSKEMTSSDLDSLNLSNVLISSELGGAPTQLNISVKSPSMVEMVSDFMYPEKALENGYAVDEDKKAYLRDLNNRTFNEDQVYYFYKSGGVKGFKPMDSGFNPNNTSLGTFIANSMRVVTDPSTQNPELRITSSLSSTDISFGHDEHPKMGYVPLLKNFKINSSHLI